MRDIGRSRRKTAFDDRAARRLRAKRKHKAEMNDQYWDLRTALDEAQEDRVRYSGPLI